jgi:4-hydroxybenzoate polyprenyltransferase
VGALGLRVTLRSHRCDVGSIGLASRPSPLLDRCLHGSRAIRRNGIQPLGGRRTRWKKPSDKDARFRGGQLTRGFVGGFTVVTSLLFLIYAAQLNRLTLLLAPAELGLILLYSYTKRFTRWSHLVLGSTPAAAWMAIRGTLDPRILVLTLVVLCWVGGFDTLYACQDAEHDRREGLKSLPAAIGIDNAFWLARALHVAMFVIALWLIHLFALGPLAWVGVVIVAALLLYEHSIVSPGDLTRMNAAFFTMNGVISIVFFIFVAADILVRQTARVPSK